MRTKVDIYCRIFLVSAICFFIISCGVAILKAWKVF